MKIKEIIVENKLVEPNLTEGGPFSYGAEKPRKGSVAYNAEVRRKEQEKSRPPIEPKDQMVGTAKVTKGVTEGKKDPDELSRYENDVKTLLANGDIKTAKKVAGLSPDAAHRNHLRNIIRHYDSKQGVAEGSSFQTDQMVSFISQIIRGIEGGGDKDTYMKLVAREMPRIVQSNPKLFRRAFGIAYDRVFHIDQDDDFDYTDYSMRQGERGVAEGGDKTFTVVYYSKKTDRTVTKQIKASSESELWARLRAKDIDVISVEEQGVVEGSEKAHGWKIGKMYRGSNEPFEVVYVDATDENTALAKAHHLLKPNHMQILTVLRKPQGVAEGLTKQAKARKEAEAVMNVIKRLEAELKDPNPYLNKADIQRRLDNEKRRLELYRDVLDEQGVVEGQLNELAPGFGGDGRWYTDYEIADIVGEDWLADDLFSSGANMSRYGDAGKEQLKQEAQEYLEEQGYSVEVLDVRDDEDHLSWLISGPMMRPGEQDLAEGAIQDVIAIKSAIARLEQQLKNKNLTKQDRADLENRLAKEKERLKLYPNTPKK